MHTSNNRKSSPLLSQIVFLLAIMIIGLSKINLVQIGSFSWGIRFEDFAILFLSLFFIKSTTKVNIYFVIAMIYLAIVIVIGSLNANSQLLLSIFSYIRILEYLIFYRAISHYLSMHQLLSVIFILFIYECFFAAYQLFYMEMFRTVGSTAGPWELAMICISGFILLSSYKHKYNTNIYFLLFISLTIFTLYAASARAQILALGLILMYQLFYFKSSVRKISLLLIILFCVVYVLNRDMGYISFNTTFNFINQYGLDFLYDIFHGTRKLNLNPYTYTWDKHDISLIARLSHWREYIMFAYDSTFPWVAFLIGSGPNARGLTTDGMYIKLLVDFGMVGLIGFFMVLFRWAKDRKMIMFAILIAVSSITLDWIWASKYVYYMIVILVYVKKYKEISKI
jgi:hypothetical protein